MKTRAPLTVRVVPLTAHDDTDLCKGMTPAERFAMVWTLTQEGWLLAGRAIPTYSRADAPVCIVPLIRTDNPTQKR